MQKAIRCFILVAFLIFIACEGPRGPTGPQGVPGPQGEQGEPLEVYKEKGVLPKSEDGWWEFTYPFDLDKCIINVYVRITPEYAWWEPYWCHDKNTIWIRDAWGIEPNPGYEYQIKIAR